MRSYIGELVTTLGNKVDVCGFGRLEVSEPSTTASYDRKKLDSLVMRLTQEGNPLAIEITQCRTESTRAGTLRITRSKSG